MFAAGGAAACRPLSGGVDGATVVALSSGAAKSSAIVLSRLTGTSAFHASSPMAASGAARSASTVWTAPGSPMAVTASRVAVSVPGSMAAAVDSGDETTGICSGAAVPDTFTSRNVTSGSHHGVSMRTSRLARLKLGSCGPSCSMIAFTLAPKEKT